MQKAIHISIILFSVINCFSFDKIINKIGKEDFLSYNHITTPYDNAAIIYEIGEFHVFNDETNLYIRPTNVVQMGTKFKGNAKLGVDDKTAKHMITESFTIPTNGKIQFYRNTRISSFSSSIDSFDYSDIDCNRYYAGSFNNIPNQQEYQLHLKDASSKKTITILDSIGYLPNVDSYYCTPYGTNPKESNIEVDISKYSGKRAYLQVLPIRRGSVPTQNKLWNERTTFNKSFYQKYDYEKCTDFPVSSSKMDTVEANYLLDYLEYAENMLSDNNSHFNFNPGLWNLNPNSDLLKKFKEKYYEFELDTIIDGKEFFVVNRKPLDNIQPSNYKFEDVFNQVASSSLIDYVFSGKAMTLSFNILDDKEFRVEFYLEGKEIQHFEIPNLEKGIQEYVITLDDLDKGKYYTRLIHNKNEIEELGYIVVE